MKPKFFLLIVGLLVVMAVLVSACQPQVEQVEVTRVVEVEGETQTLEVTRVVTEVVEGEDVEVTRVVEVELEAQPTFHIGEQRAFAGRP